MRRYAFISLVLATVAGVIRCGRDESLDLVPTLADADADAGAPTYGQPDGSVQGEGGGAGANASDANGAGNAGNDAGEVVPKITSSLGPTGDVHIFNDYVTAAFHEDDTILRSDAAPDCVVH